MAQTKTAAPSARLEAELAKRLLTQMQLIRRFEEKAAEMYAMGKIGGFLHLYIGQEAVAVGATSTTRTDDYAVSSYREHGHCLAKGSDPKRIMAELFGRRDGLSKGKGGSMHLFDKSVNFLGGHGIVGAHLPLAAGAGFGIKYQGSDQVVLCYFGDGAETEIWRFAETYGIHGEAVDGMDVLAIRECVGRAVERARRDKVPALIEARTYRFRGHSMRDPAGAVYRSKDEVEREKLRDPIALFSERALKDGALTEADLKLIEKAVYDQVDEAVAFAEASPEPSPEDLFTDVYKD